MREQTKNMLIGLFVIAACCLVVALILFLEPDVGDGRKILHVRFSNINKINVGTRVLYAGKPVGEVVQISEISDARHQPTDSLGRLYFYDLTLKLDSSVQVYNCDDVSVQTSGLLGEKSISITPCPAPKGETVKEVTSTPIYASSIDPLENAFNQLSKVANKMDSTLNEVNVWLQNYGNETGKAIQNFGSSMQSVHVAVQQMIDQQAFLNTSELISNLKTVSANLSQGKGSIGKFLGQDDFYLRVEGILGKVDTLMNDINHYGILFHLNKGWQRVREQRMNAFGEASSAKDYAGLLQSELSDLNTSMARLSMIADKMDQKEESKESWTSDKVFVKEFTDLLNRSKELTDKLKLFNEQLFDNNTAR